MAELVPLKAGDLAVDLAPDLGGAIFGFSRGAEPILRATPPTALSAGKAQRASAFAMIPYSNRIGDAHFGFGGEDFELTRNFGDSPHAIHGNGWQRAWSEAKAAPSEATLHLSHVPDTPARAREWPFAYDAEQRFVLTPDALAVTLALTNRDTRPMPAGFGLHPYFERDGARLRFAAETVWASDQRLMPTERGPVLPKWDASSGRAVDDLAAVDHCFEGWGGTADITYEARNLRVVIEADPVFSKLMVFRADEKAFFAVEPITHMVDAVNRMDRTAGHGLKILSPGETLCGSVTFRIGRVY